MKTNGRYAALIAATLFALARTAAGGALPPERETLELHAHLFMKEGMGVMAKGGFNGPLEASDWTSRFGNQANPEALERSEIGIVVAALYAHPLFTWSLRASIRRQIAIAEGFVARHPNWIIARDARQAREALTQGRRVMILALEGASGILEDEADLKEFIDEKGVRIVNLLHLTDDHFGGVAFEPGFMMLSSPWAMVSQALRPHRDPDGVRINANGLTADGREMAAELLKRHVWLDLAHASDASQAELIQLMEKAGQPLLYTHTTLRKYMGAERAITAAQLAEVARTGGMVGVMPADTMLGGTPIPGAMCPDTCHLACKGGLHALAVQYGEIAAAIGADRVALGSDTNGGVAHLAPTCPLGTALDERGLWNIGLQAAVWDSLEKLGEPVPKPRSRVIDRFLEAWEKARPSTANSEIAGTGAK